MQQEKIDAFTKWWSLRKKKGKRVRGLPLSEETIKIYQGILKSFPDFEINYRSQKKARAEVLRMLKNWEVTTKRKLFPQVIFCLRSYLSI